MTKPRSSAHRPKLSRFVFIALALVLVAAGSLLAFWPRPTLVDLASVRRGPLQVSVDEEGRALVRNPYLVAAPAAGRLERVTLEVGDRVVADTTPLARLWPSLPPALDERAREQARAVVKASMAALEVAKVERSSAETQLQQAQSDLSRIKTLFERGLVSLSEMERYQQAQRGAQARLEASQAAIALREAELARAEAQLMDAGPEGRPVSGPEAETAEQGAEEARVNDQQEPMTLFAPIDGQVLRVLHQSQTPVAAGTPILEVGDIEQDLMVEVALVSSDAVRIQVGDEVALEAWGGPDSLKGKVARIEPIAVTKVSALGVEEQRVRVTIDLLSPAEARPGLGHGYRLKVRVITWQDADALIVPAAALFREDGGWVVFAIEGAGEKSWNGQPITRLVKRAVTLAANNGLNAALAAGLGEGEQVVLYPDKDLQDGQAVASRN